MNIRMILINSLTWLFHKLKSCHIIPDVLESEQIKLLKHQPNGYEKVILGSYAPADEALLLPETTETELNLGYAQQLTSYYEHAATKQYGYFVLTDLKVNFKFGTHYHSLGVFVEHFCSPSALKNPKYEVSRWLLKYTPRSLIKKFDQGYILFPSWNHNYYHWLVDILPRLSFLQSISDASLPICIGPSVSKNAYDALALIINDDSRIHIMPAESCLFKKAILPTNISAPFDVTKDEIAFLQDKLASDELLSQIEQTELPKKVYISRADAGIRKVTNEEEVIAHLESYGFTSLTLSQLPLTEQVALFKNAEVIITHHGAALANLVFCSSDTDVIEIFQDGHFNPSFYRIACMLKMRYYFMVGAKTGYDTTVDLSQLSDILKRVKL